MSISEGRSFVLPLYSSEMQVREKLKEREIHDTSTLRAMKGRYRLPEDLVRHASGEEFASEDLRAACREAGEGLGRADAEEARFRSAAAMVALWRGLDLPAWKAPYVLRDVRLGYINGYERALVSGGLSLEKMARAAEARWGKDWRKHLDAVRKRAG